VSGEHFLPTLLEPEPALLPGIWTAGTFAAAFIMGMVCARTRLPRWGAPLFGLAFGTLLVVCRYLLHIATW